MGRSCTPSRRRPCHSCAILVPLERAQATSPLAGHETVNHSQGEYVRGNAHVNTAEGYFSLLKRGINGIYHHVGKQHLGQYLGEFDFRYNTRGQSDGARTIEGIRKIAGKRLMLRRPGRGE